MASNYASGSYAARSAAAYNNVNTNMNRNYNGPSNMAPRAGTFPSVQAQQQNYNYSNSTYAADQQSRLLNDCSRRVQEQAYYMRRAMDEDDLATALERATFMLAELGAGPNHSSSSNNANNPNYNPSASLGSSKLSPKNYYELQMKAMDEMPNLEEFFLSLDVTDDEPLVTNNNTSVTNSGYFAGIVQIPGVNESENATGTQAQSNTPTNNFQKRDPLMELYETVQYCPRVLPRLYLQICAGSALLRSRDKHKNANSSNRRAHEISVMKDLMDHVKCVQCPIRGLFLRNYVLNIFKYPMEETLEDLYKYLLQNFVEMNQLWVRIQHLPNSRGSHVKIDKKERRRREKERNELRLLVGTNLVRLSQLDGITPAIYKHHILPPILEQVVTCHDALAQAYLMDCIIQVFPDDFHIESLSIFLDVLPKLKEKVNVRTILQGMMERLSNYYTANAEVNVTMETFEILSKCVQTVATNRTINAQKQNTGKHAKPNHSEIIHLQTYLFQFSLQNFPDRLFHLDQILNQCADTLNIFCATAPMDSSAMADLEKLLMIPLEKLSLKILELKSFGSLLEFLPWQKRRTVAKGLIQSVIADGKGLQDVDEMESLLRIITPLLKDVPDQLKTGNDSMAFTSEIEDDQNWVAKLVHLFDHEDTDVLYQMLNISKKYFSEAGKGRIENTLASLVFASFRLVQRVYALEFDVMEEEIVKVDALEEVKEPESKSEKVAEEVKKLSIDDKGDEDGNVVYVKKEEDTAKETLDEEKDVEKKETEGTIEAVKEEASKEEVLVDNKDVSPPKEETPVEEEKRSIDKEEPSSSGLFDESKTPEESAPLPLVFDKTTNCRKIFLFLQKVVSPITPINPELAYSLYLQIASLASSFALPSISTDFNTIAYEFLVQAFSVYGDDISESKAQIRSMTAMVGTLSSCRGFSPTEFGALVAKTAQFSARLLKKPDQCKMVTLCSHLFYTGDDNDPNAYRHPQRVLECLQRSLKIADACTMASASNVNLFIDILDHYVFYFEKGTPLITDRFVSGLIALINEHLARSKDQEVLTHYKQILKYVQGKKGNERGPNKKFAKVVC